MSINSRREERGLHKSLFCFSIFSLIFFESSNLQSFLSKSSSFSRSSKIFIYFYTWLKKKLNMKKVLSLFLNGIRVYLSRSLVDFSSPPPPEWDTQYPRQGQTAADAPPGYITLFEDFFLQGNFRLPATKFMAHILHYYGFHVSQLSPPGMVRVRHFEFLCRSHGIEPIVEKFRVFYQLIRNIGFYTFGNRGSSKKILLNPPKSFHDWKMKFFFIREVIPIAMIICEPDTIEKKELAIPKGADWYLKLTGTPNWILGENVLVTAQMSDKWPEDSNEVHVLTFQDRGLWFL
ncbi:hypothetical protein Hanom_Chr06g00529001 [Helianthus anomalus]